MADVAGDLVLSVVTPPDDPEEAREWATRWATDIGSALGEAFRLAIAEAVESYAGSLTAAAGDLSLFDAAYVQIEALIAGEVGELMLGMNLAGGLTAVAAAPGTIPASLLEGWTLVVNDAALGYQMQATNRIVGASSALWSEVRDRVVVGLATGQSNEDVKRVIEDVSGYAEQRADTIARTEAMAAYSGGDLAGARALGGHGPVAKRWLSALDARTRESHADADGQLVPLNESFNVGGVAMDRPLDPAAPPEEVVNCRCTVELVYDDDPTLTVDERAALSLTAAAGAPSGVCVVALPEGDLEVVYNDGDSAPVHQTLVYLGSIDDLGDGEAEAVTSAGEALAGGLAPFSARVVGVALLGEGQDRVAITEAVELQAAHDDLLEDATVAAMHAERNGHPSWISHVSGDAFDFGDEVRFDRVAVWIGPERTTFELSDD